jgi:sRNA-binding protein
MKLTATPAAVDAPASKRQRRAAANNRVQALLCEHWPTIFSFARPLAIGIDQQIIDALGDQIDPAALGTYLAMWTHRPAYLAAVERDYQRVNLDGSAYTHTEKAT